MPNPEATQEHRNRVYEQFKKLEELGYHHTWDQSPKHDTEFLTTIASKFPILSTKYHQLHSERFIVEVRSHATA